MVRERQRRRFNELGVAGHQVEAARVGRRGGGGDPATSPDGTKSAFIKDYNLWIKDTATAKRPSSRPTASRILAMQRTMPAGSTAHGPSLCGRPDGKKIATFQDDERDVSDVYLVPVTVGAPKLETWKSALPGDPNVPMISRVVIDVDSAKVTRLQVAPDPHRSSDCDDISCDGTWTDVYWAPDSKTLAFLSTSRDHKDEKLRVADASTGAVRDVYEETDKDAIRVRPGRYQLALSAGF